MNSHFLKTAVIRFTSAVREEMTPVSSNFLTLDFLRFLSSLIIIVFHYKEEIATERLHELAHRLLSHGHLFVDLFFVISGFIISYVYWGKISSKAQYGKFMIKRIARLWPLHILLLLAYLGIWGATTLADIPLRNPDKYDVSCIVPHALMLHAMGTCDKLAFNYVSWSISAEMGMYVLTPLFFMIAVRSIRYLAFIALIISCTLIYVTWDGQSYLHENVTFGLARAIPSFVIGICLFLSRSRLNYIPIPNFLLFVTLILFFILSIFTPELSDYILIFLIYGIAIFAISADMRGAVPTPIKRLAPLGNLTYGSYMLHPIISTVIFAFVAQHILGLTGIANDLTILLMIPLSFIAAVFSLVLIETPCRRLFSNR
ncbi:MAG: acyltransferase [Alphaproteobacteria bacterium]|nr:acyltransferase [Alphaproteobacteria bacterium]